MISKDKQYRTRDGREARVYATDGHPEEPIHGAFKDFDGNWNHTSWYMDGTSVYSVMGADLIEVKPRIKRTMWVNVYPGFVALKIMSVLWPSKERADNQGMSNRIACVKIEIDCEEGEGL